jgi:hypothetical protein
MSLKSMPKLSALVFVALAAGSTGCAGLAQPFDQLKAGNANVYVYRLQNYEPPTAPAAGAPAPAIPKELQTWISGAASMLPPGLIPPGLIPGSPAAAPPAANAARFHNFRILGWIAPPPEQRDAAYDIFGKDNFEAPTGQCPQLYAEFGISFQGPGPQNDILVSLSCNQVQTFNFNWPHGNKTGLTASTAKRIVELMQKSFGG